jgi:hypothetical protein
MTRLGPYGPFVLAFLGHHVFFVLALLPGFTAICAYTVSVRRRKQALEQEHRRYRAVEQEIEREPTELEAPDFAGAASITPAQRQTTTGEPKLTSSSANAADSTDPLQNLAPQLPGLIVGAIIVTTVFLIAAALSDQQIGIGPMSTPTATATSTPNSTSTHAPAPTTTRGPGPNPAKLQRTAPVGASSPPSNPTETPISGPSARPSSAPGAGTTVSETPMPPAGTPNPEPGPNPARIQKPAPVGARGPSSNPTETPISGPSARPSSAPRTGTTVSKTPTPTETPSPASVVSKGPAEGERALVIAAYGSYITTIYLLIDRLNSSGVSGTFLVNCGLRTAIALVLAFVTGDFGVFGNVATPDQAAVLYLLLGMFPVWAIDFIRRKGLGIFQINEAGCESVPLCLVDGLDDGIIDRLAESGMWDVQHLAVAEPRAVSVRTLYPLVRVIDWIDQALLIVFVKSNIVHYRALGIRAATNLAAIYGESEGKIFSLLNAVEQQTNAKVLIQNLATKTNVPIETVQHIGRCLFYDRKVRVIWRFCRQCGTGPSDLRILVEAVFEAVRQAAQKVSLTFTPDPKLGAPVSPTLGSKVDLKDAFVTALDQTLARLGYRWAGTFTDIRDLQNWRDVVNTILNKTISI